MPTRSALVDATAAHVEARTRGAMGAGHVTTIHELLTRLQREIATGPAHHTTFPRTTHYIVTFPDLARVLHDM